MSTLNDLISCLKDNIQKKLDRGETSVARDLSELRELEQQIKKDAAPTGPIRDGAPLRVKRSYTMTDAARAQRQAAAPFGGPKTPEAKRASSKNGWIHGKYSQSRILGLGKPCRSTCPDYPCSLVEEDKCRPGADCLDKEHLVESVMAIERALKQQDYGQLNDLMVMELAETLTVVRELRASILEHGAVVEHARVDKEGTIIGYELKPHPSLLALPNLMKNMGISFTDFMLTPAAIERKKTDETVGTTIADIFRTAGTALTQAREKKAKE